MPIDPHPPPSANPPVVLVTGANGGLGRILVQTFHECGWRVIAASRRRTVQTEKERIVYFDMDVTHAARVQEVVRTVEERWGGIDVLVNNAGAIADASVGRLSLQDWDTVMQVNLHGAMHCAQAVLRGMVRKRRGHIINMASHSGKHGAAGQANYAAAKAGLIGFTKSLAREVGSRQVRVNAVLPGVLPTRMTSRLTAEKIREFERDNVLGKLNSLEEVARFIVFLADMKHVSGQVFTLDSRIGGW